MALPLDDLSLLDGPPAGDAAPSGAPLQLPLDLIDEDPDQPRTEFDEHTLRELAETIARRGVRQPISVRPHPREAGRWMLNFGARRLRASRLAGRQSIPAFVDAAADSFDQVIENEQRQSLTPLELALFVQKQQQAGLALAEIARRLGKTRGYLTFVGALIDAPEWLLALYRSGACRGMTELYELRKLGEKAPEAVSAWLRGREEISRGDVARLRSEIEGRRGAGGSREEAAAPKQGGDVGAGVCDGPERPRTERGCLRPCSNPTQAGTVDVPTQATASGVEGAAVRDVGLAFRWGTRPMRLRLISRVTEAGEILVEAVDEMGVSQWVPIAALEAALSVNGG